MKLTKEEREWLDGEHGEVSQKAMELLVAVGECYDAPGMIPVASAHLVAANPGAGKGGTTLIIDMAKNGGNFIIPLTTNPAALDPWDWREMGFSEEFYSQQVAISEALTNMGGFVCNTCTPYLIGHVPRMRSHVAWGESSATIYANAVLGARTNREGGPTALASAITGRSPLYGYHLEENRYGTLKVMVNTDLKKDTDYAALGYFSGRIAQDGVPVFTGIPHSVSRDNLKCLGASLASSGSVAHYHVVGVTPEAPSESAAFGPHKIGPSDTIEFGPRELKETQASLCSAGPGEADLVILGCPHPSIEQVKVYAQIFSGRKVKDIPEIWVLIPHAVKQYAEDLGYAQIIETSGARLASNACPGAMPLDFFEKQGYRVVATDAQKIVYNVSTTKGARCYFGSFDSFVDQVTHRR